MQDIGKRWSARKKAELSCGIDLCSPCLIVPDSFGQHELLVRRHYLFFDLNKFNRRTVFFNEGHDISF